MKEFFNLSDYTKIIISIFGIIVLFIVFYFIKNFKTIDIELKFLLIILIIGLVAGICLNREQDKNIELLKNNFYLTTGSIDQYIVTNLKGKGDTGNSIKYIYSVDNHFFVHSYGENYYVDIPNDKPDLSILYLVIYEKTNPKNSFILLNYPVNSSQDLERYKDLFKDKIPEDAIKQN
ncbi:hypothetical protein [[Flexibacter] sp. ATCC 35103]|uniref:hypothetical protein n=1 Tax=[Flexibacter] sp. ATCC 35103 TaxID=1937528 RepID=UPI0009C9B178|nr:hypothetical protein [[Flexibacter] sp. ATCC 35103]OMQ12518.1 hypothetical protein BXU01_06475 [[Flexibacter] sp. ATCC 35103]